MNVATMWKLRPQFLKAMEQQNVKKVTDMLDAGFDIDHNLMLCKNAISLCVSNGWHEIARVLVLKGCSLSLRNNLGQPPLTTAVLQSEVDLVEFLLNHRADPCSSDFQGMTALHYACNLAQERIVDLLTSHPSRKYLLSQQDVNGDTPLNWGCKLARDISLVHLLLTRGSDPNVENKAGATSIYFALFNSKCNIQWVQMLVDWGANVNHQNLRKQTPLHLAFEVYLNYQCCKPPQYRPVLHFLISRTRDISAPSDQGTTPLHLAVMLNDSVVVRWLLNRGADVNARDALLRRPIDLVQKDSAVRKMMEELDKTELQNQCRKVIRGTLYPKIEEKVQMLPLPQIMRNYISLLGFN